MSACCHLISMVRGVKILQKSQKKIGKTNIETKVYQWVEMSNWRTAIVDKDCSGCLTASQVADSVEGVNGVVKEDNKLFITCGSVYAIIHNDPDYHKIWARWVPKQLTDECKQACMKMSKQVFQWCCGEGEEVLLQRIVIHNGTMGHLCEPGSKYQSMEWKHIIILNQEI